MIIEKRHEDNTLTLKVIGRIDTLTATELEKTLKDELGTSTCLVFDFSELDYISSAGLRILLAAQKIMNKQGKMIIRNVCSPVMDVFNVTGFTDILSIE